MLHRELQSVATAIMFLTRIPVGSFASGSPGILARSTQYFPVVGGLIGLLLTILFLSANLVWSTDVAVGFVLLGSVLLTGAFHEDGLADVADSMGAWTRDRKLEIMRDSRIGTYGASALLLILLLKYASISSIFGSGSAPIDATQKGEPLLVLATLVLAHVLARWSSLPLICFTAYARDESANKVFAEGVTTVRLTVASCMMLAIAAGCAMILGRAVLTALLVAMLLIVATRWWYLKSVNGITGDCLGATNQLVELAVYLSIAGSMPS